jgi:Fuc2NAc and GlcNAc transferase
MTLLHFILITICSFIAVYITRVVSIKKNILDTPNNRSSHTSPTPRFGGLGFISIFVLALIILLPFNLITSNWLLIFGFLCLVLFSMIDDLNSISPLLRLSIHILFSITVYFSGFQLSTIDLPYLSLSFSGNLSLFLTVFYCVAWINVYNFMDGMNGYAGTMGITGFSAILILSQTPSTSLSGTILLTLIGSLVGFLFLNIYRAKTFMGDGGSAFLGGMVSITTLHVTSVQVGSPSFSFFLISILCFLPFLADASITLIRRAIKKEKVWEAHNKHFYQLLMRSGVKHFAILGLEFGYMLLTICFLYFYIPIKNPNQQLLSIALLLAAYLLKYIYTVKKFKQKQLT